MGGNFESTLPAAGPGTAGRIRRGAPGVAIAAPAVSADRLRAKVLEILARLEIDPEALPAMPWDARLRIIGRAKAELEGAAAATFDGQDAKFNS